MRLKINGKNAENEEIGSYFPILGTTSELERGSLTWTLAWAGDRPIAKAQGGNASASHGNPAARGPVQSCMQRRVALCYLLGICADTSSADSRTL